MSTQPTATQLQTQACLAATLEAAAHTLGLGCALLLLTPPQWPTPHADDRLRSGEARAARRA
jgi:hypothetical protein